MVELFRDIKIVFRFGEFVCSTVILGLTCYFLNYWDRWRIGPKDTEIFIVVLALVSIFLSVFCLLVSILAIPQSINIHLPFWIDFIWAGMWFVAFGLLVKYLNDIQVCGAAFTWSDIQDGGFCGKWKADLAFAFIGAMLWLLSCAMGFAGYRKVKQQEMDDAIAAAEKKAKKSPPKPSHWDDSSLSAAQEWRYRVEQYRR